MSARAIQALRKKQGDAAVIPVIEDESEEDDEEESQPVRSSAFALMHDSDESSADDESSQEDDADDKESHGVDQGQDSPPTENPATAVQSSKVAVAKNKIEKKTEDATSVSAEPEPDLDELLQEFQAKDGELADQTVAAVAGTAIVSASPFNIILAGMDPRDLDYDFSMRTSLLGGGSSAPTTSAGRSRKNRQALLFGPPRVGWSRPPHYVGGGIGMTSYDREPRHLSWPYEYQESDDISSNQEETSPIEQKGDDRLLKTVEKHWFTFMHSDSYQQDCGDYKQIQQSGDLNALVMFVAHHPFVTEALLQLTTVLYQTNHSQEGLALLRRCLWIYECSSLLSFARDLDGNALMDHDQPENQTYFRALFRLVQVSNIAGLPQTSLAVSRYILSLDPLRDPMGVLLALDHYALAANAVQMDQWLVNLVESETIRVRYRDMRSSKTYRCTLLQLPNWAFSYALALFRLHSENPSENSKSRADMALQAALGMFPHVVGLLLQDNEVDTTGRSFRRDWLSVLDFATDRSKQLRNEWWSSTAVNTIILTATLQACDLIVKIFVLQNAKLYSDDDVLQWLFDNLEKIKSTSTKLPESPSPAMLRYASSDPSDYENKIQMLPPDVNIVDPNLIAHAMEVNTNRPRFIRRMPRGGGGEMGEHEAGAFAANRPPRLLGPPTNVIDPDWPMAEVFWRSFLPWNHVEGIPPPRP